MQNNLTAEQLSTIRAKCLRIIDGFEHRGVLRESDIREWVGQVVGEHGEQAPWHATRASGFGGSDIGVLVRNYSGFRADHMASAHDIVEAKLLRSTPMKSTGDLERGHFMEPLHAGMYYKKWGAKRDEWAFNALAKAQGPRTWMRYSPDEVALIPSSEPNPNLGGEYFVRVLADYKAPRVVDESDEIHFQYSCQLHQGAIICALNGIHLDGLQLSQFDWAAFRLKDDVVPYDVETAEQILAAGDHYWACVQRGEIPHYVHKPRLANADDFIAEHAELGQRLAQVKALSNAFKDEVDRLTEELAEHVKPLHLGPTKLQLGDLAISSIALIDHEKINKALSRDELTALRKRGRSDPKFDTDAMAAKLREHGVDATQYQLQHVEAEPAYELLKEKGLDPEQFMKESLRMAPSKLLVEKAREIAKEASAPPPKQAPQVEEPESLEGVETANESAAPVEAQQADEFVDSEGSSTERQSPRVAA